jgi:hypothetical protein
LRNPVMAMAVPEEVDDVIFHKQGRN